MTSSAWMAASTLAAALVLDLLIGEPPRFAHPVVGMGTVASWYEKRFFSRRIDPGYEFFLGFGLLCGLVGLVWLLTKLILELTSFWPWACFMVSVYLLKSSFALRELGRAANKVERLIRDNDLTSARKALGALCSRDSADLSAEDVAVAAVASLAENLSDSVVAPLFYYLLLGIPGALCYRAVNTLDAMIGYHGKYEYFGKAAARMDDLLNFIPARISAVLIILAGCLRKNAPQSAAAGRALAIARRDHGRPSSLNGGWPMAAAAGLLGIVIYKKDCYALGDAVFPCTVDTLALMNRVMRSCSVLWSLIVAFVLLAF